MSSISSPKRLLTPVLDPSNSSTRQKLSKDTNPPASSLSLSLTQNNLQDNVTPMDCSYKDSVIVLGTINLLSSTSLQVVLQLYRNSTETKKITHGVFLIKLSSNGHLLQITIIDNH